MKRLIDNIRVYHDFIMINNHKLIGSRKAGTGGSKDVRPPTFFLLLNTFFITNVDLVNILG